MGAKNLSDGGEILQALRALRMTEGVLFRQNLRRYSRTEPESRIKALRYPQFRLFEYPGVVGTFPGDQLLRLEPQRYFFFPVFG